MRRHHKRSVVRTDAKQGFCFGDNYNFDSTQEARYGGGCSTGQPDALDVRMGISKGWADLYAGTRAYQFVDITNLANGRYRLKAKADRGKWFKERKEKNNFTWVDIQISGDSVSVIRYGPSAKPISG